MLPTEIHAYVMMHWELAEYATFSALKKFVLKYVRVIKNIKNITRPLNFVGDQHMVGASLESDESQYGREDEEELPEGFEEMDVEQRIECLAFMKQRGFKMPTRGMGVSRRQQERPAGGAAVPKYMPPRARRDLTCINCGKE